MLCDNMKYLRDIVVVPMACALEVHNSLMQDLYWVLAADWMID
jgi:hypothetical protein